MEPAAVLAFAAIAFTLVVVPGPDWAFVLAAGTHDRVVAPAVGGLMAGYALITLLVAAGVGPLVAGLPLALTGLTVAGAGYLVHLGVRTLRGTGRVGDVDAYAVTASSPARYFIRGVGVSALNPKGLLIFLSVLPQFTRNAGGWPPPAQLATLGGVFVLIVALFYLPLGYAAERILGVRPHVARITTYVAGTAMVLVGVALLVERLVEAAR